MTPPIDRQQRPHPRERRWLDNVRQVAPRMLVVMCLVAVPQARFNNYGLFRWSALASLVAAPHGLISGTLVARLIGLAIVVGGVLVAGSRAQPRARLRAADVPRALVTTLAIWVG